MLAELVRDRARARPRRYRGAQSVSLRPRIPRAARAHAIGSSSRWDATAACCAARPRGCRSPSGSIAFRRYDIYGRNIVDTWILAQHYDIAQPRTGKLRAEGPGEAFRGRARRAASIWTPRASANISSSDPDGAVSAYALDDVRETRGLAEVLSPSYFVQAQIFPYSYPERDPARERDQNRRAADARLSSSAPFDSARRRRRPKSAGGYTEMRRCGVARNVLHCDVTSLYPSLMIEGGYRPASDRAWRFSEAADRPAQLPCTGQGGGARTHRGERRDLEALQQTFKILINSFYGYLGFSLGHFNDFAVRPTW